MDGFLSVRIERMNGAGKTWIEGMDSTKDFQRALRIGNRIAQERCFVGTVGWKAAPCSSLSPN